MKRYFRDQCGDYYEDLNYKNPIIKELVQSLEMLLACYRSYIGAVTGDNSEEINKFRDETIFKPYLEMIQKAKNEL